MTTYAAHPGVVASEIWRRVPWPIRPLMLMFMSSIEKGALTQLHCATSPRAAGETGLYYEKCRPRQPSALAQDRDLAAILWQESEQWVAA